MALELLAGPFTITNRLTGDAIGASISGFPAWIDGRGLVLPITNEGVYVVQMDGTAYAVIDDGLLLYGLALRGVSSDPRAGNRWYGLIDRFGNYPEQDVDLVTLYRNSGATGPGDCVAVSCSYARLHDRYIYPFGGTIYTRPLDLSSAGAIEESLPGLTGAVAFSWGSIVEEIIVGASTGQIARYDWISTAFRGSILTIGMTCLGIWWSTLHGVYVSLHSAGGSLTLRVWAATVQPDSVSAPAPDAAITSGRRTRIRVRVLGAHSDPCEGEVVAWALAGVGALSQSASLTDSDGYASTYYEAPLDGGSAAIEITAEVAV